MGALLKLLVLALVVVWLLYSPALRGLWRGLLGDDGRHSPSSKPKNPAGSKVSGTSPPRAPDAIVPCAHCGIHLPLSEAMLDIGGRTYCSDAHRLAGPRA